MRAMWNNFASRDMTLVSTNMLQYMYATRVNGRESGEVRATVCGPGLFLS